MMRQEHSAKLGADQGNEGAGLPCPSRRAILRGIGAGAATVGIVAAALAADPFDADTRGPLMADDAELLALEQEWLDLDFLITELDNQHSAAMQAALERMEGLSFDADLELFQKRIREAGYTEADEANHRALEDRQSAADARMMDLPASSAVGVAVKLRMLARWMRQEWPQGRVIDIPDKDLELPGMYAMRVLRDAERLAGETRT